MDLIRELLLSAEAEGDLSVKGYDEQTIVRHLELLEEAGLIKAGIIHNQDGLAEGAIFQRLTWAGHDFLDAARDNTIWAKARKHVLKPAASWTFGLLVEFLKEEAKRRIFGGPPDDAAG